MRATYRFAVLGFALLSIAAAQAQTPRELVQTALRLRDSAKGARLQRQAASRAAASASAYPSTRLEFGSATRPDVTGGEDLTLFQPLDIFGKTNAARASGAASVRMADATLRQAQLDIQHEVLVSYATWANAARNLRFAQDQLALAQQVAKATQARVEARSLPEIQNTRATLEVQKAEQAVVDDDALAQAALVKLRQLVAKNDLSPEPDALKPEWLSEAGPENQRPELMTLRAQESASHADARQAALSRFPDLELQARRSPWSSESEQYGVRIQLAFPLWDHGAGRQKQVASNLEAEVARFQLEDTRKRIAAEIEAATIQLKASEASLRSYTALAVAARDLLAKIQRGFELGASTLIDVLDAKRALSEALGQQADAGLRLDLAVEAALQARGQILEGERK